MALNFKRGAEAIAAAQERAKSSAGDFTPFTPTIWWNNPEQTKENTERYVLFLNPLIEIPNIEQMIGFVPTGRDKVYEQVIARTDDVIGEDRDPMVDEWGADPKEQNVAVAVELEPTFEEVRGRRRPVGFEVAVREFERKIRDKDGKPTDKKETVEAPIVGFVTQSPHNFFNLISSTDAKDGPIEYTPLRIARVDKNTYKVDPFLDQPVDLANLLDLFDNLSYIPDDDKEDLITLVDQAETDHDAAMVLGDYLLNRRLEELVDRERYDKLFKNIDSPFRYGTKGKSDKSSSKASSRRERPARSSQRRGREAEPEAEPQETPDSVTAEDNAQEPVAEEPKPRRGRRAKPAEDAEPKAEAPVEQPKEEAKPEVEETGQAPARVSRLDELRKRSERRRAEVAAE
jgi:hypothetical protein